MGDDGVGGRYDVVALDVRGLPLYRLAIVSV